MVSVINDFGNPFEVESQDLLVLDTKEIATPRAMVALYGACKMAKLQLEDFVRERFVEEQSPFMSIFKETS